MASLRKLVHNLMLLIPIGLLSIAPASAASDALIWASGVGNLPLVKVWLDSGADVNAKDAKAPLR